MATNNSILQGIKTIVRICEKEVDIIFHDSGVFMFCILVPLFYPLLYSLIYTTETVHEVPITVIDDSKTALSREFIRKLDASSWVKVVGLSTDVPDARLQISKQNTYGFIRIPSDFTDCLSRGEQAFVGMYGDMSGMLYYKGILIAATEVSLDMNEDIKIRRLPGMTAADDELTAYPVTNREVAIFNPTGGFAGFLIPAVLMLIIQQTLLLSIGMADGTATERGEYTRIMTYGRRPRGMMRVILGRTAAYMLIYAVNVAYMVCIVPRIFNLVQVGNALTMLVFLIPYILACIFFAQALSVFIRNREMGILIFVVTSVPLLFVSGISWPGFSVPPFWKGVSWLFPSTFGINGFVRINTMGASLSQVMLEWEMLWVQSLFYCTVLYFRLHRELRERLKG